MNEPPSLGYARTIFMDLVRESPIGGWPTNDRPNERRSSKPGGTRTVEADELDSEPAGLIALTPESTEGEAEVKETQADTRTVTGRMPLKNSTNKRASPSKVR